MKSATVGGATSTYTYDGDGKRASKTIGSTTTNYVYDVNASLPNVLTDGTLKYVYGLGLAYTVDGSGNDQVYHTDGLGSVRAITDNSGNVIAAYQTDEFGILTQTQGGTTQPFQFTGQQRDAEDGLYYLRARMYDPSIGRFLSRDTAFGSIRVPGSLNRYVYALDDPVGLRDPGGRCGQYVPEDPCGSEEGAPSASGDLGALAGRDAPEPPVPPATPNISEDSYAENPDPSGLTNEDLLAAARAARDERARQEGRRVATVTAGFDSATGRIVTGCSAGPTQCAEDEVARLLHIDPRTIRFTEAARPRLLGTDRWQVPVCLRCQGKFSPDQFPTGTMYSLGGEWERQLPYAETEGNVGYVP